MSSAVLELLKARGETVCFAESCTGGRIAASLVDNAGASDVLAESYVTYSNAAKMRILGVTEATLRDHGAVSAQCAREMADGARRVSGSTWGVSATGVAGPDGGTPEKPVGTVFVGVSGPKGTEAFEFHFRGNRDWVRTLTVGNALNKLRLAMK